VTLAPLLHASPAIRLHAFAAMGAFVLGTVQLAAPKGTLPHRTVGWVWVVLMLVVSISAFSIHELRIWGQWSPIHLLAIFTLAMLPVAVWRAHKHEVEQHRRAMLGLFPRCAGDRWTVHVGARSYHVCGDLRRLSDDIDTRLDIQARRIGSGHERAG
jgi:uncharacterized membrane protein